MTASANRPATRSPSIRLRELKHPQLRRVWNSIRSAPLAPPSAALLLIDLQRLTCDPSVGRRPSLMATADGETVRRYYEAAASAARNASQVLAASRQAGLAVVHTHLVSATANGRDVPELMKRHGLWATGDTPEAQFLEAVRPAPKELVLARTSFSFFTPELGDQLLRNLGITTLIVAGVATDAAVASTVRDAADRGYSTILVEDACAASSRQDHGASVDFLELWYCEVAKAAEVAKAVARRAIVEKEEGA